MYPDFSELKGKTLEAVLRNGDVICLLTTDGQTYRLHHQQDCCESVTFEDCAGDPALLIGEEILVAEERTDGSNDEYGHSTWTFYNLQTMHGDITLRWYGSSNGYYSESVSIERMPTALLSFEECVPLTES